jgi:sigma-B regulation protein RsbU (phosphoserine phosphatase)
VDTHASTLRYACAGHNPPLLVRAGGESEWLSESGVPLGVVADSTYKPVELSLGEDDVLVLYSDGVTEAERPAPAAPEGDEEAPPEPEFFDEHRLESLVREIRAKSASNIVEAIVSAVNTFTGGADLSDDLTLVVVKITAGARSS